MKLKIHPRDDLENRALSARAEEKLGAVRLMVGECLTAFLGALEGQDPDRIGRIRESLKRLLDEVDDCGLF